MIFLFLGASQGSGYTLQVLAPPKKWGRCGLSAAIPSAKIGYGTRIATLITRFFFIKIKPNNKLQISNFALSKLKWSHVQ